MWGARLKSVEGRPKPLRQPRPLVLACYPQASGIALILDALVDEVLLAVQCGDLAPVFSFSSEGLRLGVGRVGAGDPTQRLTRWREVLYKVRAKGPL